MRKYYYYFERYIGRSLYKWERRVIAPLEYIRQHKAQHRVVVVDPPGYDSRWLLCQYIRFIHDLVSHSACAIVMARTKADAARVSRHCPSKDSAWLYTASGLKPDSIRGRTAEYALILDADCYFPRLPNIEPETAAHFARRNFRLALGAVAPIILNQGENFIIIHIRGTGFNPDIPVVYERDPSVPRPVPGPAPSPPFPIVIPLVAETVGEIADAVINLSAYYSSFRQLKR